MLDFHLSFYVLNSPIDVTDTNIYRATIGIVANRQNCEISQSEVEFRTMN